MMLYCVLIGLVLASSYCRAYVVVEQASLEQRVETLEYELEHGGKQYQTVPYNSGLVLRDHDYLRLQFLGARNAWLGCPDSVCDLRMCPSVNNNYANFETCGGENFQIINDGPQGSPIKSGQLIRLRLVPLHNAWIGCPADNRCDIRDCPGTTLQGKDFTRCGGEILTIYARGRANGETIYNGDVVMLHYNGRYVSIQGQYEGDDNSLNFCPGVAPPAYLSYGICSKNAFRIYRRP